MIIGMSTTTDATEQLKMLTATRDWKSLIGESKGFEVSEAAILHPDETDPEDSRSTGVLKVGNLYYTGVSTSVIKSLQMLITWMNGERAAGNDVKSVKCMLTKTAGRYGKLILDIV